MKSLEKELRESTPYSSTRDVTSIWSNLKSLPYLSCTVGFDGSTPSIVYDEIREGVYSSHFQKEQQLLFSRKTCKKVCLFVVAVVIFLSSRSPLLLYNRHFTELLHHNIYNCQHVTTFSHPPSLCVLSVKSLHTVR